MKNKIYFAVIVFSCLFSSCTQVEQAVKYETKTETDKNGYSYEYVTNDPFNVRIYTLKNGLKVYLTINKDEPRIHTLIPVRTGSTNDPAETTGLAHYLEHMMFKGTSKIGTQDWEKEKVFLDQISALYEEHKSTDDTVAKKAIYRKIDSISNLAAEVAVANEYDKMVSSIGAKYTNAWTSQEETVYFNNIPSNELEKWLFLERERFGQLVLRFFHTELETVYEEFNRGQDSDYRKVNKALMEGLFKKHPYGTQTTLGRAEHLKNPSMVNIHHYFDTYYVSNNMAICMSGDLDFEKTVQLIDKYWGDMVSSNSIPENHFPKEDEITAPAVQEVYGPDAESLDIGFRLDGVTSEDDKYTTIINHLLTNYQAGLIDLNLVQKQKVLFAYTYSDIMRDYGYFVLGGNPREDQSLEEVKDLLLGELDKIKKGEFEDWLLEAVLNDLRLSQIKQVESNWRVYKFIGAFINSKNWADEVSFLDDLEKITKQQIVDFANRKFGENYVVVYKRNGKDSTTVYIDKPQITEVKLNRDKNSVFYQEFKEKQSEKLAPVFVDFKKDLTFAKLKSGVELSYIKNVTNELFNFKYIVDMGSDHDKKLALAVEYLPFIGTSKYFPAELREELFKAGLELNVYTGDNRSYVFVSGLDKSLEQGIDLLEHVLSEAKADHESYNDFVEGLLKEREDNKLSKYMILNQGMASYGKYGAKSPFTNVLTSEELKAVDPNELTAILKSLLTYRHRISYYGQRDMNEVKGLLDKQQLVSTELEEIPAPIKFVELDNTENTVYFVHYDMVQCNVLLMSKDVPFDEKILPQASLYQDYFGSGLSSLFFQEIREAKGLAYTASSSFTIPDKPGESFYLTAFVGTQPDKLEEASTAMINILNNLPEASKQFDVAKEAIQKRIESERIIKDGIFWTYLRNNDLGINYDIRENTYNMVQTMSLSEFGEFFDKHIASKTYTYLVLGNREKMDMKLLGKLGKVKELTLDEVFNY